VKQRDGCVDWTTTELLVFEGHAHIFSIEGEGQGAEVHVEADSQDAFFLELLAEWDPNRVTVVPKLAQPIVGEPELIVREGRVNIELLLCCHANLELMVSPGVRHNLPIVDAI